MKRRRWTIHAVSWLIFISYELLSVYLSIGAIGRVVNTVVYYLCNIVLFYAQVAILDARLSKKKPSYLNAGLLTLAALAGFNAAKLLFDWLLWPGKVSFFKDPIAVRQYVYYDTFRNLFFIGLAALYWASGNIRRFRLQAADAENALLRQQLNPHLLFNTLNFIYGSVEPHSAEGSRSVLLLADIMRFSMADAGPDGKVRLTDELEQLENLIQINQYRYDFPLALTYHSSGALQDRGIIPLVLLTLTENLFKHGDLRKPSVLEIQVSPEGKLTYFCRNEKKRLKDKLEDTGLGLHHVRLRLEHAYPGQHRLDILEDTQFYQLQLTLMT